MLYFYLKGVKHIQHTVYCEPSQSLNGSEETGIHFIDILWGCLKVFWMTLFKFLVTLKVDFTKPHYYITIILCPAPMVNDPEHDYSVEWLIEHSLN